MSNVTVTEAAALRGVPRQLIYHWIKRGWLSVVETKPAKVDRDTLLSFTPPKPGRPKEKKDA